jgi:hypothetical protein
MLGFLSAAEAGATSKIATLMQATRHVATNLLTKRILFPINDSAAHF